MKVLILPSWYPDKDNPIRGIFFKQQAEFLANYKDVSVISLNMYEILQIKQYIKTNRNDIFKENNVDIFKENYIDFIPREQLKNKSYQKKLFRLYDKLVEKKGKPDIIHAHVSFPAGYGAMILSEKYKIPFVVTEHASYFDNELKGKNGDKIKMVLQRADYYTAVSSFLSKKIINAGRNQCDIIPNFISFKDYNCRESNNDRFNLINISSMHHKKGIDLLLYAFQKAIKENKNMGMHLHLVGDGIEFSRYKQLAHDLGLANCCSFYGSLSHNEVITKLNYSDALIITSRIETFCIVGIEAMACGIPVISTACGGPEDYINNENGILVENENIDQIAEAIIYMYTHHKNYNQEAIKEFIQNNYDYSVVCKKWIQIYNKIKTN